MSWFFFYLNYILSNLECAYLFFHIRAGIETEGEDEWMSGIVYWCLGAFNSSFLSCLRNHTVTNTDCVLLLFHTRVEIEAGEGDE
jgi:hypothetical protein